MDKYTCKIPLFNANGDVGNYAIVDEVDYANVSKFKWRNLEGYAKGKVNGTDVLMHRFIVNGVDDTKMIDHIDGNRLNNRRENLRIATHAQNSQNKQKKQGTTSKYIGVSWHPEAKKWVCWSSNTYLGSFESEEDAARKYDTWVLLKYGEHSKTNNLVRFDSVKDINPTTLLCKREERVLPTYIYEKREGFEVFVTFQKKKYRSCHKTLDDAEKKLLEVLQEIEAIKEAQSKEHFGLPILRNAEGIAIIPIKDSEGNEVAHVRVSDDDWHECMKYKWYKSKDYYQTNMNGKKVRMHRLIIKAKDGDIVDHIDGDPTNNQTSNLRLINKSGVIHKRKSNKETTSSYVGVSFDKKTNKYQSEIRKDGQRYFLGTFDKEEDAAIAYNKKAEALYGEYANLNTIV